MVETISQLFLNTVKTYIKDDLLLYKKEGQYIPISTQEYTEKVKHFSLGLRELGLGAGDKMIILSENRPEWVISDMANLCLGGITVPIYTTLVPEQVKYIIDDSDAKIVLCSQPDLWQKVWAVKGELTKVTHYISFNPGSPEGTLSFEEVIEKGKQAQKNKPELFEKGALEIKPSDIASIIYTSGTTGLPKGVMLMHSNFVSNVVTCAPILPFSDKDTAMSLLPLSHVFERMVEFTYLYKGCTIGYGEGFDTVAQNLLEIRPHMMAVAPRVLEKFYARVMDNVLTFSSLKRKIFYWALKVGRKYSQRKLNNQPISGMLNFKRNLANKLVYSKIIARTGGRVRFFISGSAPLSKDIAEFFYVMGLVVMEGYGLTETSPVISVNTFDKLRFGTVGPPIPGVEVKIADDGEILTRGPHVMQAYYKKEEATREVFDGDWFRTGDIGHIDEDGFLVITDRKKDIIVTSGGKNVAPQPIENMLKINPFIENVVVIGDRRKFISALVVPNFEKLGEYARSNNIPFEKLNDLVKDERIRNFMEAEVDRTTPNLASYEKIKKISLMDMDFEQERGEVTPTLKVKRNIIEERYKNVIDAMYRE
ncbi:MAG: long-chain fatty acid--CoA ligase [Candidatus Aminicenantes bacterium]|nr:long-chain fatty acid--CoA ligase [Candidatus Aminicenantes bacterium]MDH5705552.1 long-chain fatty acid--CoA ligase [Candidatus Aminicenantes bacterium]